MALYEVLEDGTIVPKAGKTVGGLGCLRTEVVYDKNSSDSNKNWGYTRGIKGGVTVSGKDFSKYSQLKIYVNSTNIQYIYEMDLTTKAYKYVVVEALSEYPYVTGSSSPAYDAPANDMRSICAVSDDKTKFYHFTTGYNNGATYTERNDYEYYYIYKIEGILKEPAMIYTGKELFAGNGISVKDGVVSSAPAMMWYKMSSELRLSTADTIFKLPCTTIVSSSSASGKLTAQSDGSIKIGAGVSLVKVSANFQFYLNTIGTFWGYIFKNESSAGYLLEQMKDSSYRNIPMSLSPILIQVSQGDTISIRAKSTAGTNNGVQNANYIVEVVE